MKILKFILISLTALLACSCGIKEREMRYDKALLEEEIVNQDLMVAYQVPAGFKMVRQSFTDSIAAQEMAANPFSERRMAIFVDTLLHNANICLYDMRKVPYEKFEDRMDFYFSVYNQNGEWESIEKYIFKHGDFEKIVELAMVNTATNRRLMKYFFYIDGKAQLCVDYYMRNDYYSDLQPFIESSVASFKKSFEIIINTEL